MNRGTVAIDLDGTLITCEPRQSAVLRAASRAHGRKIDIVQIWQRKRSGVTTECAMIEEGVPGKSAKLIARLWQQIIEEPVFLRLDSVFPNVRVSLTKLRERFDLALITSRSRPEWVPHQLRSLSLQDYFENIYVVNPAHGASAKSKILRKVSANIFFGDSEMDWFAARDAGAKFFAVATGQRSSKFLKTTCALHPYASIAEAADAFLDSYA
jgi:phosphoglycolate phosphatase-like HAD superfamily hydrolase